MLSNLSQDRLHAIWKRGKRDQPPSTTFIALKMIVFLVLDVTVGVLMFYYSGYGGMRTSSALIDSFYLSSATVSTTGYGDVVPTSYRSRMLTFGYIIFNALIIHYCVAPSFNRLIQHFEGRDMARSKQIVLCAIYSLTCLAIGILPFRMENTEWKDILYAIIVSFTSTGYGDYAFRTLRGRMVGSVWLILSYLLNYRLGCLVFEAGDNSFAKIEAERNEREVAERTAKDAQELIAVEQRAREVAERAAEKARDQIAVERRGKEVAERAAEDARDQRKVAEKAAEDAREKIEKIAREQGEAEMAAQKARKEAEKSELERQKAEKAVQIARQEQDKAMKWAMRARGKLAEAHKLVTNAIEAATKGDDALKAARDDKNEAEKLTLLATEVAGDALEIAKLGRAMVKDALALKQLATSRLERLMISHATELENLARAHSFEMEELRSRLRDAEDLIRFPESST